jgi:hypothetical protein
MQNQIIKDPRLIAALRMLETSAIVSVLAFLATLATALQSPAGIASYDWHSALASLALGIAAGLVNALTAYLTAVKGSVAPPATVLVFVLLAAMTMLVGCQKPNSGAAVDIISAIEQNCGANLLGQVTCSFPINANLPFTVNSSSVTLTFSVTDLENALSTVRGIAPSPKP